MVSRIDIGPDGGPYVAINENSNNLELQDINGNVIAKWDETAGQWDLNNNSLTGINTIDASSANVGDLDTGYGHQVRDGESIQDTIDRAEADGVSLVKVPSGIYEEEITVGRGMRVTGTAPDQQNGVRIRGNSDTNATVTITDLRSTITHLSVQNEGSGDAVNLNGSESVVAFCGFATSGDHLRVASDNNRIVGNQFFGRDLIFEDGADNNVYVGNTDIGTVDDSGSGNTESNT